jgi:hypothetical protein
METETWGNIRTGSCEEIAFPRGVTTVFPSMTESLRYVRGRGWHRCETPPSLRCQAMACAAWFSLLWMLNQRARL